MKIQPHTTSLALVAAMLAVTSVARAQYAAPPKRDTTSAVRPARTDAASRTRSKPTRARSAVRIPVTKREVSGGEVALPPGTSASVRFQPSDTTSVVAFPPASFDSSFLNTVPEPVLYTPIGKFFVGIAAGASIPSGAIYNGYNPGWNVTIPISWDSYTGPLGLRLDLGYDRLTPRSTFRYNGQSSAVVNYGTGGYVPFGPGGGSTGGTGGTGGAGGGRTGGGTTGGTPGYGTARVSYAYPQIWSAMLDGKLRIPFDAYTPMGSFYVIGGGGVHYLRNYSSTFASTNPQAERAIFKPDSGYSAPSSYRSLTRFGLNAGAGVEFGVNAATMFVEARYVTVLTHDARTSYWPVLVGVSWH